MFLWSRFGEVFLFWNYPLEQNVSHLYFTNRQKIIFYSIKNKQQEKYIDT